MKKKILVIEDILEIRQDIREVLENFDFDVIEAENGSFGVQLAQEHLPDLILSDIMMPGMNGYQVLETLSLNPETATIPFIFLTAKADLCDLRQGMNLGADDYLTKPFSIQELYRVITIRLEKQATRKRVEEKFRESETEFRQLAQREELLNSLIKQIRNSLELKTILNTTLDAIRNLLAIHRCSFFWYRKDVKPHYFEKINESFQEDFPNLPRVNLLQDEQTVGEIIIQHNIFQTHDITTDPQMDGASKDYLESLSLTSVLAVTIKTNSQKLGVIVCEHFIEPRSWNSNEVALLQAVGDQLAIAIDQAELYSQSRFSATTANIQAAQLEQALSKLKQTQAQLIQTEKMSSLGQMVAGVAHEINNPVNFIYGNINHLRYYIESLLELLRLYQQDNSNPSLEVQAQAEEIDLDFIIEDIPKLLDSLQMGADRIRQIVLTLRNFSRLDESDMKHVDIHEGIDSTLFLLQNRLKGAEIEIIKEYANLPKVECYPGQLNQVFMNILVNAIDALEACVSQGESAKFKKLPSRIKIATQVLKSNSVEIRILDNGIGISEEVQQRLFDPFFTTKPVGQGTGLGLCISYQIIVEKHRGEIQCISSPGEGTEFCLKIPISQRQKTDKSR